VLSATLLADVFGVDALVVPHPELPCPMIVARGPIERTEGQRSSKPPSLPAPAGRNLQGGVP
jgi:hypothetical protein